MDRADHLRRSALAVAVALVAASAAACGGGDGDGAGPPATGGSPETTMTETGPPTETTEETTNEKDEEQLAQSCTNEQIGYTVRYPDGWFTNSGDVVPRCRFFHPSEFEVPKRTEALGIAISIRVAPLRFDRLVKQIEDSQAERVRDREQLEVDGRRALRLDAVATGQALLPQGTPVTRYYVALDGRTLIASALGTGELDHDRNREVLKHMIRSLDLRVQG